MKFSRDVPPVNRLRRALVGNGALIVVAAATGLGAACGRRHTEETISLGAGDGYPGVEGAADAWRRVQDLAADIELPSIPDQRLSIVANGAVDGFGNDSRGSIQAAIDATALAGGGRVVVPPGNWFSDGPLRLQSRIDLHVAAGAHLRFSGKAESYLPEVLTRWEGTEVWTYSPFIFADEVEDVAITGTGKIDGQGEANFLPWRERQKPDQDALRQMGIDGVPVDERRFGSGHWLRPHFVQFRKCRRVLVDGPTFVDSPFWVNHLLYCEDATVRNVEVVSRHINSDGVDVDSSSRVLIEDCRFDVGDDGVAIKSGRDQDGWRVHWPSTNVVVRRCRYLGNTGGAMAIGSEMSGGVSDVYVMDYSMREAHHALYFKSNLDRGGKIERVYISDIDVGRADSLLIFTNDYHSYRGGDHPARFEDVLVENVRCGSARIGLSIVGHERAPVRDVTIRNLKIDDAATPLKIRHTEGLEFEDVTINGHDIDAPPETGEETFEAALTH